MDLIALLPLLSDRLAGQLDVVSKLEAAVKDGIVPNTLFVSAKDTINRAIESGAKAFLDKGPHVVGRRGEPHHQSDWWLDAYDADAFVSGAHGVPAALKRASKVPGLKEYAAFLTAVSPLNDLLKAAKPLIKKRSELPKVKTERELADEAKRKTCQCCGRLIFAETGTIAHHGYERPGYGYQTASCMGAKELPFEADRAVLGRVIDWLRNRKKELEQEQAAVAAEKQAVRVVYSDYSQKHNSLGRRPLVGFDVTRATFEAKKAEHRKGGNGWSYYGDFDDLKKESVDHIGRQIKSVSDDIKSQSARFNGWKMTHKWDTVAKEWVGV